MLPNYPPMCQIAHDSHWKGPSVTSYPTPLPDYSTAIYGLPLLVCGSTSKWLALITTIIKDYPMVHQGFL